ncbi:MAG: hypothetical protein JW967_02750 [Dehalococcoidales bacterium]|nr:hypothetical protein [Dehalococcoidales bacterium]
MPDVWRIYRIKNCRHTNPSKDKFAVIVCQDEDYLGFLINSEINQYTLKRPYLLECQLRLSTEDYHFLFHVSYLDCARLYPFNEDELGIGLELISDSAKVEIKAIVSKAITIEKRYQDLIIKS